MQSTVPTRHKTAYKEMTRNGKDGLDDYDAGRRDMAVEILRSMGFDSSGYDEMEQETLEDAAKGASEAYSDFYELEISDRADADDEPTASAESGGQNEEFVGCVPHSTPNEPHRGFQ